MPPAPPGKLKTSVSLLPLPPLARLFVSIPLPGCSGYKMLTVEPHLISETSRAERRDMMVCGPEDQSGMWQRWGWWCRAEEESGQSQSLWAKVSPNELALRYLSNLRTEQWTYFSIIIQTNVVIRGWCMWWWVGWGGEKWQKMIGIEM